MLTVDVTAKAFLQNQLIKAEHTMRKEVGKQGHKPGQEHNGIYLRTTII